MEEQVEAIQKVVDTLVEFGVKYGFQVVGALIVLVIGYIMARWAARAIERAGERKGLNLTLRKFLADISKMVVLVFAAIIAMKKFGISIDPFIAAIGAMAFGLTFALQGPVSNYGAGLVIILTRPFIIGNTITVNDVSGVVEEIKLATTILSTEDGERITVPNKRIVGEILINSFENKVVEGVVGISYGDDPDKAISVITDAIGLFEQVPSEPAPQIGIQEFGDSSVNIGFRYWVPTKQYCQTAYAVNGAVFRALKDAGISIPFPQREVTMLSS